MKKPSQWRILMDGTILFCAVAIALSAWWTRANFKGTSADKIFYNLRSMMSFNTVNDELISSYYLSTILPAAIVMAVYLVVRLLIAKRQTDHEAV